MNKPAQAGKRGEALSSGENVLRLVKTSKDGRVPEMAFELTTQDKTSRLQSLSVWVVRLTTPEQAREFMGDRKEAFNHYCLLNVDEVRLLKLRPDLPETPLDVVWDPLLIAGTEEPDIRPGAEGHAGIMGLMRPPGIENCCTRICAPNLPISQTGISILSPEIFVSLRRLKYWRA